MDKSDDQEIQNMIETALDECNTECVRCRGAGSIKYEIKENARDKFPHGKHVDLVCPDCQGKGRVTQQVHLNQIEQWDKLQTDNWYIEDEEGLKAIFAEEHN